MNVRWSCARTARRSTPADCHHPAPEQRARRPSPPNPRMYSRSAHCRSVRQTGRGVLFQRCGDASPHGIEDLRRISQANVVLCRMDVGIDVVGRQIQKEHAVRMAPHHGERRIAARPGAGKKHPAHEASVDEKKLHSPIGAIVSRFADEAASVPSSIRAGVPSSNSSAFAACAPKTMARRSRSCSVAGMTQTSFPSCRSVKAICGYASAKLESHDELRLNSALGARRDSRLTGSLSKSERTRTCVPAGAAAGDQRALRRHAR